MNDELRMSNDELKMNDELRMTNYECLHGLFNRQSSIVNRHFHRGRQRVTRSLSSALISILILTGVWGWGEEVDRVLAAANGKVITESDLRIARNLNALLLFGKKEPGGEASRQEQISRLIDLELIRQELTSFPLDPGEQSGIEALVEELKEGYAEIGGLAPLLRRLGLQAEELQDYLRLQASILRFVNLRFRPFVSVSQDEVRAYYRDKLAPKLQAAGAPVPPVEEVSSKIEDVLKEEKVNAALDGWIKELRSHSRIEYFPGKAGDSALHMECAPRSGTPCFAEACFAGSVSEFLSKLSPRGSKLPLSKASRCAGRTPKGGFICLL
jgi:hypothetical protein